MILSSAGCDKAGTLTGGLLEGKISIGPICPVETVPPSPNCLPTAETYKAYPVGVWTTDGSRMITLISPALDGTFSVELNPGQYSIRRNKNYGVGGSNLPMKIIIIPNEKTTVSISIDTGIR